jgi:hypothetical protein
MKIKLKESINSELIAVGLRPGMEIESNDVNKTTGAVQFIQWYNGNSYDCVVWPEDYEIVTDVSTVTASTSEGDLPNIVTLPIGELTNALDAMFWVFSPYLDNSDNSESPWIENMIKSYNEIVILLPHPYDLRYHPV